MNGVCNIVLFNINIITRIMTLFFIAPEIIFNNISFKKMFMKFFKNNSMIIF